MKLFFLLILSFIPSIHAELAINEVMYNPEGNDNNREYVEVYTDLNLSGFTIEDLSSQDILEPLRHAQSNYSIIVEEGFNFTDINANVYSAGATIGNSLNNDRDIIVIKNLTGSILDVFSYTEEFGANNNGLSLCRIPDRNGIFKECDPTLATPNRIIQNFNLKITELMPNPPGEDNATMPNGEWVEIHNLENFEIELAGFFLKDDFGRRLYISNAHVINSTRINKNDYLVIYANGFSGLLNNEGFEMITLNSQSGNTIDSMSYDNSQEGTTWALIDSLWLKSNPTPGRQNPRRINIKLNSDIKIDKVYLGVDEKAKWGDTLRIKLKIYKGNTSQESIQARIFKDSDTVSKRTTFDAIKRFEEQTITIPVQIYQNCDRKYKDDNYELIVNGLGIEAKEKIKISGINPAFCESESKQKDFLYELIEAPTTIELGKNFDTLLKITNNLDTKQKFTVWAQIKKDQKIVTQKDKDNVRIFDIPSAGSTNIKLNNLVDNIETGIYELNVNILPENKKRPKSITTRIEVIGNNDKKNNIPEPKSNLNEEFENETSNHSIFESKSTKQRKLSFYILVLAIGMMSVYGITKND